MTYSGPAQSLLLACLSEATPAGDMREQQLVEP